MAREVFSIQNVKHLWKTNFSGEINDYNPAQRGVTGPDGQPIGHRRFTISLPEDVAEYLKSKGANIRVRPPQNPDDETLYSLECFIGEKFPPKPIYRISKDGKQSLTLATIGSLDSERIDHMDLDISFSPWEYAGKTGFKAYVNSIAVFVNDSEFESRYRDIRDLDGNAVPQQFVNPNDGEDEDNLPF